MKSCRMTLAGETSCGCVRPFNEDNFCVAGAPDAPARLAVVADGLGGHEGGAQASFVCCRSFLDSWRKKAPSIDGAESALAFLRGALMAANKAVFAFNRGHRERRPMGCTVAAAVFLADVTAIIHAGDSRIYIYNEKGLRQLSEDHTLLELLRKRGDKKASEERVGHIVTRAVGVQPRIRISSQVVVRQPGDRFMLCSDGVSGCCAAEKLADLLKNAADARTAVISIIEATLRAGSPDNATVIVGVPES